MSLKLNGEDIKLDTEKVNMLYPFLKDSTKEIKVNHDLQQKKKIVLPKWIERNYIDLYFSVVSNVKLHKLDFNQMKRLISVCEYFRNNEIIISLISENILPTLDKFTCLKILKDYLEKLENQNTKHLYIELIQKSFETASKNIFYLINNHQNELALLKHDCLEEIIERLNYL